LFEPYLVRVVLLLGKSAAAGIILRVVDMKPFLGLVGILIGAMASEFNDQVTAVAYMPELLPACFKVYKDE
jgi:hypothetical protein